MEHTKITEVDALATRNHNLDQLHDLLCKGWCQSSFRRSDNYCLLGGINKITTGEHMLQPDDWLSTAAINERQHVLKSIHWAFIKQYGHHGPRSIMYFNDLDTTTKADVLAIVKLAKESPL